MPSNCPFGDENAKFIMKCLVSDNNLHFKSRPYSTCCYMDLSSSAVTCTPPATNTWSNKLRKMHMKASEIAIMFTYGFGNV
jgi:hypothetical protein